MTQRFRLLALGAVFTLGLITSTHAQTASVTGRLELLWGDPVEAGQAPRFSMAVATDDGRRVEVVFADGLPRPWSEVLALNGHYVRVNGVLGLSADLAARATIAASSWERIRPPSGADDFQTQLTGSQPWVTILCKFADYGNEVGVNTGLITGTGYPTLDEYWRETSFNNINLAGSAAVGWVTLPQPRSYYISNVGGSETANLSRLANDCTLAADPIVNFNSFIGVNMMFNQSIGPFLWGGSTSLTRDGAARSFRAAWIGLNPTFPAFLAGLAHEMGHGFGMPHSSGPYGFTYDSRWDVMSSSYVNYNPGLNDYIPQGTISYHKDLLAWIPVERRFVPARNSSTTIVLDRLVAPNPSGTHLMARIPLPNSPTRFYTVEMRAWVGRDVAVPANAVVIHDVDPARSSDALVVDPDGNGDPNDAGARWTTGETFIDNANGIRVTVLSLSQATATVLITTGDPSLSQGSRDFDGDLKADIAVYRPSNGVWYVINSSTGAATGVQWGEPGDIPVPADYDGDGRTDAAVFRPSNGTWWARTPIGPTNRAWGGGSDLPVPADYDGDGRADIAVFRPSNGTWYIIRSGTNAAFGIQWGAAGDVPVPGDYDGDGRTEVAVFRPSDGVWYIMNLYSGAANGVRWGAGGDVPLRGDFDGDRRADIAVYRPSDGVWYVINSSTGAATGRWWGEPGDIPVAADYDGDRRTDVAVFRPSSGTWYIVSSATGTSMGMAWGGSTDVPVWKRP